MTSATVDIVSAPPREPDDDDFMVFSRNLTQAFVDIYTVGDSDIASRGTGDADEKATRQNPTKEFADRLKEHGDQLNVRIMEMAEEQRQNLLQSVWEVTYSKFETACNTILNSCQRHFRSGWEQVAVVYMTVGRLIPELRANDQDGGVRERQMEEFAGQYFNNTGLRESIETAGGMRRVGEGEELSVVDIRGTDDV